MINWSVYSSPKHLARHPPPPPPILLPVWFHPLKVPLMGFCDTTQPVASLTIVFVQHLTPEKKSEIGNYPYYINTHSRVGLCPPLSRCVRIKWSKSPFRLITRIFVPSVFFFFFFRTRYTIWGGNCYGCSILLLPLAFIFSWPAKEKNQVSSTSLFIMIPSEPANNNTKTLFFILFFCYTLYFFFC